MWSPGGVDEDDNASTAAAAAHLLRRALRMLGPYRRQMWCSPGSSWCCGPARRWPGRSSSGTGIDHGIEPRTTPGALDHR